MHRNSLYNGFSNIVLEEREIISTIEYENSIDEISQSFIDCLWEYVIYARVDKRTLFKCTHCKNLEKSNIIYAYKGAVKKIGNATIKVISSDLKTVYSSSDAIFHYCIEHNYKPPKDFVDAVIYGPKPESELYCSYMKNYYGDVVKTLRRDPNKKCGHCGEPFFGYIAYQAISGNYSKLMSYSVLEENPTINDTPNYITVCYNCWHYTT
ncbi:MAG: hypothetical protein GX383_12045 [Clostridium sp.]|jgi:hypothetical protein|nr:hypothetical protein [Clostridium sp.]